MRKTSITRRFAVVFSTITIVMLIAVSTLNIRSYQKQIQNSMEETMNAVVQNNSQRMETVLGRIEYLYHSLTATDSVTGTQTNKYLSYFIDVPDEFLQSYTQFMDMDRLFSTEARAVFEGVIPEYEYSAGVLVNPEMRLADEQYLTISRNRQHLFTTGRVYVGSSSCLEDEEWYAEAKKNNSNGPYWFVDGNKVCMTRNLTVMSEIENSKFKSYDIGMLLFVVDSSWFANNLVRDDLTPNTTVAISTVDEKLLWQNREDIIEDTMQIHDDLGNGLVLHTWISWSDIRAMTKNPIISSTGLLIVFTVLGSILVMLASYYISKPIRRLTDHIKHYDGHLITDDAMLQRRDEIGSLYRNYNKQLIRLHEQEEKGKQLVVARLQAQINPHFLYNTLDSLCFVAMMEGKPQIADALSSTAQIFRYNTKDADGEVLLSKELEILDLYMNIYIQRSSENIQYEVSCADELRETAIIPKMIIQPLVENALFYGLKDHCCAVHIACTVKGECLEIAVTDSGDALDISHINGYLAGTCDMPLYSTGLGILNVHRRVSMRYGEAFGLSYHQSENGKTVALVQLPYKKL